MRAGYSNISKVFSGAHAHCPREARRRSRRVELTKCLAPIGRPIPVDSRSNDPWFQHTAIIVSEVAKAYAHLRKHKVTHASAGPQRLPDWNQNAGGIQAFYFKDPDGHVLEVLALPPDQGAPTATPGSLPASSRCRMALWIPRRVFWCAIPTAMPCASYRGELS